MEVVREHPEWLNDRDTLNEMLTFVRNENYWGEQPYYDKIVAKYICFSLFT